MNFTSRVMVRSCCLASLAVLLIVLAGCTTTSGGLDAPTGPVAGVPTPLPRPDLLRLHELCRSHFTKHNLVITVLPSAHIARQLGVLTSYAMPVDVCVPQFQRWRDAQGIVQTSGVLPSSGA